MEITDEKQLKQERLKLMVTAALIIALVNILFVYAKWAIGSQMPPIIDTVVPLSILAVVFVWMGKADSEIIARYYPEEGYSYGKALGRAVLTATLSGVVIALGMWVLYSFLDPTYVQTLKDIAVQSLPDAQQTDMVIDVMNKTMNFSTSLLGLLLFGCFGQAFWGLLIALFTSIIVKQNNITL